MKDFLISYASSDRAWAEWIAWILEEDGKTVTVQAWDFSSEEVFAAAREIASDEYNRIAVLLSNAYLQSIEPRLEEINPFMESLKAKLLPLRIEECRPIGFLSQIAYLDLVGRSEAEAEQTLLNGLAQKQQALAASASFVANVPAFSAAVAISAEPTESVDGDAAATGFDEVVTVEGAPAAVAEQGDLEESVALSKSKDSSGSVLKLRRRSHSVQVFVEQLRDGLDLEMMQIPAGMFLMGSPEDELERSSSEGSQYGVSVSAFFMGKYPVTQAQWRFVAELPQVKRELQPAPSSFEGDKRPVERVSWFDGVEFCARLSAHTGRLYRLPSEAEWEYACRAGTSTPFHFGETITTDLANYNGTHETYGSYGQGPKGEYRRETTPVDHFGIANAFGLCDMHGNVWEWCQDHWHGDYEDAPADGSAWLSEDGDAVRVLRGGSWFSIPWNCRSAYRYFNIPRVSNNDIGFRVVCSAPGTL